MPYEQNDPTNGFYSPPIPQVVLPSTHNRLKPMDAPSSARKEPLKAWKFSDPSVETPTPSEKTSTPPTPLR